MSEKSDELEEAELDLYQEKVEWFDLNFEGKELLLLLFTEMFFPKVLLKMKSEKWTTIHGLGKETAS